MSNPVLTDKVFDKVRAEETQAGWAAPAAGSGRPGELAPPTDLFAAQRAPVSDGPVSPYTSARTGAMTMGGVLTATAVLFVILLATGIVGWNSVSVSTDINGVVAYSVPAWVWIGPIGGLVIALVLAFRPKLARFLAPVYAAAQGLFIGAISGLFDAQWNGIVLQAVLATATVFFAMLFMYATRLIKVTSQLRRTILAATIGVVVLYLGSFLLNLFGVEPTWITGSGGLSIVISLVVVGIAAFNLMIDFDFIERGAAEGLPKYMEWYAAFALMVTLVWLYIEILRLLAKLRER